MRVWWIVVVAGACGRKDDVETPVIDTQPVGSPPLPDPTNPDPGSRGEACYLGEFEDGQTCFVTRELVPTPSSYRYPPPFNGNPQYMAPTRHLDLDRLDPQTLVAPNFALGEVARVANGRYAVMQTHAIERLQAVRDDVGVLVVNSGYRSPGYNATIPNSATSSRHIYGDGFDLDPREASLQDLADACNAEGAGFVEVYVSHVHCDWRDSPLDLAFYDSFRSTPTLVTPFRSATIEESDGGLVAPAKGFSEGEPLREWVAFDEAGAVLDEATGPRFVPPEGTVRVEVSVGRVVHITLDR
ncbi:MAG: D-Ala-D-Ala carboxypeptidase family metallohydrolase [Myxococcota bacterium]